MENSGITPVKPVQTVLLVVLNVKKKANVEHVLLNLLNVKVVTDKVLKLVRNVLKPTVKSVMLMLPNVKLASVVTQLKMEPLNVLQLKTRPKDPVVLVITEILP